MSRAILMCLHKYTPFGDEFYEPMLDFQLQTLKKYQDEFDHVYFIDSTWDIKWNPERNWDKCTVIKVNPSLRYYDAYKEILPQIKEDLVLFMDNDMVVHRQEEIANTFILLDAYDVVSIYDTIGTFKTDKLNGKNKFCPYWFATRKELLMKYLDVEWGPNMPEHETLGKLTEKMLKDGIKPYEWEEDKSNILFDGTKDPEKGKDLGYYHVRAGSTPAVLLAWKNSPEHYHSYEEYMVKQPRTEYLRQLAWYYLMTDTNKETWILRPKIWELLKDIHINEFTWMAYYEKFKKYHGLV